jgi:sugar phosphate isomerase/epimerase
MIKSAVTISLVEEARGGPFVFWDGLADGCERAAALDFDAVEVFAPSPESINVEQLKTLAGQNNIEVAAFGTGAGMVIHGLSLTSADPDQRQKARDFVRSIIDLAGQFGVGAIIGSMQGRWDATTDHATALGYLSEALEELGEHARQYGAPLIYEPLNRYETNLVNTMADGVKLLESLSTDNVKLLADLFHMNIEEANIADAVRAGGSHIGHVHFVDSQRQAAGRGHMSYEPIAAALKEIGYDGYASVEAFPIPDSQECARQSIESFKKYLAE